MSDSCRTCGLPYDQPIRHDWSAVCPTCGNLLWLSPTDIAECTVTRLTDYGIIVELGDGVQGLIHISELSDEPISHPKEVVAVGGHIRPKVLRVDMEEKKIGLSLKRVWWEP